MRRDAMRMREHYGGKSEESIKALVRAGRADTKNRGVNVMKLYREAPSSL